MIKPSDLTWDEVVRVGAGTPGGDYLRSFWWPVALADEVKDIPVPVKILGEELVLFRDLSGHLTLLGALCAHRRASLEYGIIQENGIRCAKISRKIIYPHGRSARKAPTTCASGAQRCGTVRRSPTW